MANKVTSRPRPATLNEMGELCYFGLAKHRLVVAYKLKRLNHEVAYTIIRWPSARKGKMIPDDASAIAAEVMSEFAIRTGLLQAAQHLRRYLWTDAFAVCNFLELFVRTGDQTHRR